jgi:hypothetical protein
MVTSRSTEKRAWTAGVRIYSGRPDPVWDVSNVVAKKLVKIWDALVLADKKVQPAPGHLGYRGCFLRDAGTREWDAFGGVVSLESAAGVEFRSDPVRQFETALIASAPKGRLPEGLLSRAWSGQ